MPVIRKLVAFCWMYDVPGFDDLIESAKVWLNYDVNPKTHALLFEKGGRKHIKQNVKITVRQQ